MCVQEVIRCVVDVRGLCYATSSGCGQNMLHDHHQWGRNASGVFTNVRHPMDYLTTKLHLVLESSTFVVLTSLLSRQVLKTHKKHEKYTKKH